MTDDVAPSVALDKPAVRRSTGTKKPSACSQITNGRKMHATVDGRGRHARRFSDLVQLITAAAGIHHRMGEPERQLVRRAAGICLECENLEAALASGGKIDAGLYANLTGQLGRCLDRLSDHRAATAPRPHLDDDGEELMPEAWLRSLTLDQLHVAEAVMLARAPSDKGPLTEDELGQIIDARRESERSFAEREQPTPKPETELQRYSREMCERSYLLRQGVPWDQLPEIHVPEEARVSSQPTVDCEGNVSRGKHGLPRKS